MQAYHQATNGHMYIKYEIGAGNMKCSIQFENCNMGKSGKYEGVILLIEMKKGGSWKLTAVFTLLRQSIY